MRVQWTRSAASPSHSPLTRHLFGGSEVIRGRSDIPDDRSYPNVHAGCLDAGRRSRSGRCRCDLGLEPDLRRVFSLGLRPNRCSPDGIGEVEGIP